MLRMFAVVAVVLAVLCLLPAMASAELKPANHNGFYLGFGIGGGSAGFSVDDSDIDFGREGGLSINIRLGGAVHQKVLVGAEIDAWRKEEGGLALQYNNYAASVIYYPAEMFFIKGGPALAAVVAESFGYMDTETGFGFTVGAGSELRLATKFALVPSFQYIYQDMDGYSTNFYSFLLGFGWFW